MLHMWYNSIMTPEEAETIRQRYRILLLVTGAVLLIGTFVMHFVEKLRYIDAFYFSVVSLTTVGYGDITPKTDLGKLFVAGYLMIGIGLMAALVNNVLRSSLARRTIRKHKKDTTKE